MRNSRLTEAVSVPRIERTVTITQGRYEELIKKEFAYDLKNIVQENFFLKIEKGSQETVYQIIDEIIENGGKKDENE